MKYFIKQLGEKDCGFTCLKMLLAITYKNPNYLYYPNEDIDKGNSLKELIVIARKEGVSLNGYRVQNREENYRKIQKPVLITVRKADKLHMVLVKKIRRNKSLIYDPAIGIYWMKNVELFKTWTGEYLEVSDYTKSTYVMKKTPVFRNLKLDILILCFQFISLISMIFAFYVLDSSEFFYSSLILFGLFILSEFIYRKLLIKKMKLFDDFMFQNFGCKALNENEYSNITKYKYYKIYEPSQIISLSIITVISAILLITNGLFNLISLGVIVIVNIIFDLIEKKFYSNLKEKISIREKEIFKSGENDMRNDIKDLNNQSYNLANFLNLKKYIIMFILLSLSLLFVNISKNYSLNFLIFHFFFYLYISDNIEQIVKLPTIINDYKQYKALYLYYFEQE